MTTVCSIEGERLTQLNDELSLRPFNGLDGSVFQSHDASGKSLDKDPSPFRGESLYLSAFVFF